MGSNSASTGGGGGGVGPAGITTQGTYGTKKQAKKVSRRNEFRTFVKEGGVTGAILKGLTKGEEVNREFFKTKVQPAGTSIYDNYEDYMRARGRGEVDAYGRKVSQSDNGGNQVVQAPTETMATATAPTEAELSQSAATDADAKEEDILYRKRKTKRTGRSMLVVTSPQGDTSGLTLGKKSLLGS